MAVRDIDGYLKQEDDVIHKSCWHSRHARALCCAVLLAGVVSFSQVQIPGSDQSEVENLASWPSGMQAGAGTGKQHRPRSNFRVRPRRAVQPMRSRDVRTRSEEHGNYGQKMTVPLDSFGGLSPERKAAQQLERFFTLCAVKSVLEQMEAAKSAKGESDAESSESQAELDEDEAAKLEKDYNDLLTLYETEPVSDPDEWVQKLMTRNNLLALRIMQARKSYAANSFEWGWMNQMTKDALQDGNENIMKAWAERAFNMTISAAGPTNEVLRRAHNQYSPRKFKR